MPLNIQDADNAILSTEDKTAKWLQGFEEKWNKPVTDMSIMLALRSMPPEIIEQLRKTNPEALARLEKKFAEVKNA